MAKVSEISRGIIVRVKKDALVKALMNGCCGTTDFVIGNKSGGYLRVGNNDVSAEILYHTAEISDPEYGVLHYGTTINVDSSDIDEIENVNSEYLLIECTKFNVFVFLSRVEAIQL